MTNAYRRRTIEYIFKEVNQQFPIVLVTGPRQIGKTTFLKQMASPAYQYVTLDDPILCQLAKSDPALFLQRFKAPLIIDEIQYAPELLPYLKMNVDIDRTAGQYWLTGSQQFHLMSGVSESLAGRVVILQLLGFSHRELEDDAEAGIFLPTDACLSKRQINHRHLDLKGLYQRIWLGSYPTLHQEKGVNRDSFYSSYVQTYLQRDIRALANVGDLSAFLRFLRVCAARTGQILNIQDFCRDCDIQHITAKRWLSILENSGIIYLLEPFYSNFNQRLIKSPKLYFLDTGLAAWLTEWSTAEALEAGAMSGAILETWVVSELIKSWCYHGKRAPIYYYRDKAGKEIDILIYQDGCLYPIEIKKSATPNLNTIKHFSVLDSLKLKIAEGAVLSLVSLRIPLTREVALVPISMI